MIITVTLNPAIDKTAYLSTLHKGGLNRLGNVVIDIGGKGINVSKAIDALGGTSTVTGFIAGANGAWIQQELDKKGYQTKFITIEGNTRTNLKVLDKDMCLTELNELGSMVQSSDIDALTETLLSLVKEEDVVVLSGSVPPNTPVDIYQNLIYKIKEKGGKVILDADGELFSQGIQAGPMLIKPNTFEICKYFGLPENSSDSIIIEKARTLLDKDIEMVVVSMGAKGAVFLTPDQTVVASGLSVTTNSAVGAGDSMVGALAYGISQKLDTASLFKLAMASSAGAVMTEGTNPATRSVIDTLITKVTLEYK